MLFNATSIFTSPHSTRKLISNPISQPFELDGFDSSIERPRRFPSRAWAGWEREGSAGGKEWEKDERSRGVIVYEAIINKRDLIWLRGVKSNESPTWWSLLIKFIICDRDHTCHLWKVLNLNWLKCHTFIRSYTSNLVIIDVSGDIYCAIF